jgi:hypothetical protein
MIPFLEKHAAILASKASLEAYEGSRVLPEQNARALKVRIWTKHKLCVYDKIASNGSKESRRI